MHKRFKGYRNDERASVTIFAVVIFAFLMTFTGLVFDVGRIFNLHSQSQSYADMTALAAAAELDGSAGAIERAVRTVNTADPVSFINPGFRLTLSGDNAVNIESLTFLSAIAPDPAEPYTRQPIAGDTVLCTYTDSGSGLTNDDCVSGDDTEAAFVLVTTSTEIEDFLLFPILGGLVPGMVEEASVQPQALAGFTREICNFPPIAICNPYESPAGGGGFTANRGDQILLKTKGAGSQWAPGNFGLLQLPENAGSADCGNGSPNSASFIRCMLGVINPNTQCVNADVDTRPGEAVSVHVGLNTRFDIFDSPLQNEKNNAAFRPDVNVTKGRVPTGGGCKYNDLPLWEDSGLTPDTETQDLPKDPCIEAGTCRFGNGPLRADMEEYWETNHDDPADPPFSDLEFTTRYDMYLYENNNDLITDKSDIGGENGNPTCAPGGIENRRRLVVAVMNCVENGVQGQDLGVPVEAFLDMFLTEPVTPDDDIYAEVIGIVEPGGDDGVLHEFPVLYR